MSTSLRPGQLLRGASALAIAAAALGVIAFPAPLRASGEVIRHEQAPAARAVVDEQARTRAIAIAVRDPLRDRAPLDAAVHVLLCLEARQAVQDGATSRPLRDWILRHAHLCPDDRLLIDAFGF